MESILSSDSHLKRTILLVEDDERLANLTKRYLENNELSVAVEHHGDFALQQFRQCQPELFRFNASRKRWSDHM